MHVFNAFMPCVPTLAQPLADLCAYLPFVSRDSECEASAKAVAKEEMQKHVRGSEGIAAIRLYTRMYMYMHKKKNV